MYYLQNRKRQSRNPLYKMKTIGQLLKEARSKKKYSREKLEKETKIKSSFIEYLEREQWGKLPDYSVVVGFVKSISNTLGIDSNAAVAILRRDYSRKYKVDVNPKPDVERKLSWSPRLTFYLGITIVMIAVLGYLIFQYSNFVAEPKLEVYKPSEGEVIKQREIEVSGITNTDASVLVNNQPVLTDESGNFTAEIEIFEGTEKIEIEATSRSGRKTKVIINIIADF